VLQAVFIIVSCDINLNDFAGSVERYQQNILFFQSKVSAG